MHASRTSRRLGQALLAAAVAICVTAVAATSAAAGSQDPPGHRSVVRLADGTLRGTVSQDGRQFLGIPYAAPPVDDRRFAPPAPATPWSGVRDASQLAPACVQFQPGGVLNSQPTSEDCLYLNVYTPRKARPGAALPVVVWMHGGGLVFGSGGQYGGQRLASLTDSVVVTLNYRLGAYGYLALPELSAASSAGSGNYGLLDQIQALGWVRDNIGAFGGDTRNVTVAGESAGAGAVCSILAAPSAGGLFQRAIIQSGPCNSANPVLSTIPLAQAEQNGQQFAAAAGCTAPADVVGCLRRAWTPNLVVAAQTHPIRSETSGTPVLPTAPAAAIANGTWNKVPLLLGSTRAESKLFDLPKAGLTAEQYLAEVRARFGQDADKVLQAYPLSGFAAPYYALASLDTDQQWACPTLRLAAQTAAQVPTFEYEFNDPASPPPYGLGLPGLDLGNAHTAELPYLWDSVPGVRPLSQRPLTTQQLLLGNQMDRYWGAFAETADPAVRGLTAWPAVTTYAHPVLELTPDGNTVSTTAFQSAHQCTLWAQLAARP